jgi:hypothetical protein
MVDRMPKVGDHVIFHDPVGKPFNSLITAVWGPQMINLIRVCDDETMTDSYGCQTTRNTSCGHASMMLVHGNYWRFPHEEPNPVAQPLEK